MARMRSAFGLLALLLVAVEVSSNVHVAAMTWESGWAAVVTGSVFCDQCLKQEVFPFGRPLKDATVSVLCYDGAGVNVVASATATTDFFGGFVSTFKGVSDLGGCKAVVSSSPDSSCNVSDGGGQTLALKSKFLNHAFYFVDPLFYAPAKPEDFCPGQSHPKPPPLSLPPLPPKPPGWDFPPLPALPPFNLPPFPWKVPSTCASEDWLNLKYVCHWNNANPHDTTVGQMFGEAAQKKYGSMPVYKALQSEDDLLKQSVSAMMNSYTNKHFYMSPKEVKKRFNAALKGTQQLQWDTAWSFKEMNTGYGNGTCKMAQLTPCN